MTICLICLSEIEQQVYFTTIFKGEQRTNLCNHCKLKIEIIKGKRCKKCSRPSDEEVCQDCINWHVYFNGNDPLTQNVSTYIYNDFMKEVIAKYKYRGDYIIAELFREAVVASFKRYFSQIENFVLVPIPLSIPRLQERGFNQADHLASFISEERTYLLRRRHTEKQSKKSKIERMSTNNPFFITKSVKTIKKTVILVDDIYTTGRTVRHAATLLKKNGFSTVYSYTLIRG